jgi:hypothetical protein
LSEDEDPYIRKVAHCKDLREARRNVFLWRTYVLERTAVLTLNMLKRRGLLEEALNAFIAGQNISPFRETQAPAFLEAMALHDDGLVAAVAQFELALLKVREGDESLHVVRWPVEPHSILNCLAKDIAFPDETPEGMYEIQVSRDFPSLFRIVLLETAA